jgi:3-(3-hydroxy-phenyl)propionate hydroxylase
MSRNFQAYPFVPQRYQATLPALTAGSDPQRHRVCIVGGGISGLASAVSLASYGIRSVVLEADDGVCVGSRAICISRRSLEIVARFGVLEPFLAKGLPWTGGRSFYGSAEVLRFSMPHDENQRLPPMLNIQQYYVEQFLLEAAEKSGLVEVRWQNRVQRIAAATDGVSLSIETPLGAYELQADWLLGCDGARSAVRAAAGLELQGTSYEGRYVIVDVALRSDRPTERLAWFDPPSNPGSTILMHRQPDDVWRIDYQLRDDEDPEAAVAPENVIARVGSHLRMIGERDDWAPIWISLYKANALTLETYRSGRLLLVGDAAHLLPIFGVRGANSAFEDADNLAWKLALVLKGIAGANLLDSYSTERVYAARENLVQGMKSTEFMSPPSFGFDLMRTAVLGLAVRHSFVRSLINPRQTQAICLPINGASEGEFAAGHEPGCVARECPLMLVTGETHLSALLGPYYSALCFTEIGAMPEGFETLEEALRASGIPFRLLALAREQDHTGRLFPMYGATPGSVYLLRPDGYILGRWRAPTRDVILHTIQWSLHNDGNGAR